MQGQGEASGGSRELVRGASPKAKHTWFCPRPSRPPKAGTELVCAYQTLAQLLPPPGGESPRTAQKGSRVPSAGAAAGARPDYSEGWWVLLVASPCPVAIELTSAAQHTQQPARGDEGQRDSAHRGGPRGNQEGQPTQALPQPLTLQSEPGAEPGHFGVCVDSLTSDKASVPIVLEKLLEHVEMHGLYTEGLYRKSGAANRTRELRQALQTGRC